MFGSSGEGVRSETLYGVFKAANEESARFYARDYETPSIGLRPCVVYGPNRDQEFSAAITHALKAAVLGLPYTIPFHGLIDLQYAQGCRGCVRRRHAGRPGRKARSSTSTADLVDVAEVVSR